MSSHADCTHEKTKAARAACRAGKNPPAAARADDPSRTTKLREKAAKASEKLGQPKAEGDAAYRPAVMSAFCGGNNHDSCPGGGTQWTCQCDCHTAHAE